MKLEEASKVGAVDVAVRSLRRRASQAPSQQSAARGCGCCHGGKGAVCEAVGVATVARGQYAAAAAAAALVYQDAGGSPRVGRTV